ncbi:MAG: hypothetical protein C4567_14790, partial [Deltaproteobacteria bacterium]
MAQAFQPVRITGAGETPAAASPGKINEGGHWPQKVNLPRVLVLLLFLCVVPGLAANTPAGEGEVLTCISFLYQVAVYRQLIIQSKPVVEATNSLSFSKATNA